METTTNNNDLRTNNTCTIDLELVVTEDVQELQPSIDIMKRYHQLYFSRDLNTDEKMDNIITKTQAPIMVELARCQNILALMKSMVSIQTAHFGLQRWLDRQQATDESFQAIINIYKLESSNIYTACVDMERSNRMDGSHSMVESKVNCIRLSLGNIIDSYEEIQRMRTKYITLQQWGENFKHKGADSWRDVDVDWKEVVNARQELPIYKMLDQRGAFDASSSCC